MKAGNEKTEKLKQLSASSKALADICREKNGPTQTETGNIRKGRKNEKKTLKRKATRAEAKLMGANAVVKKEEWKTIPVINKVQTGRERIINVTCGNQSE